MEAGAMNFFVVCIIAAAAGITVAAIFCSFAQSRALRSAVEGIARNPESSGKVTVTMLIGLAMIESLCIYVLVVALILLFVHAKADNITKVLGL